jgi:prolyl-tRNA synthetase
MIVALNIASEKIKDVSEEVYKDLTEAGYEVLFDDRDISAGIKFKDADLIGIPIQIIIGEKNAKKDVVEIKNRRDRSVVEIKSKDAIAHLKQLIVPR